MPKIAGNGRLSLKQEKAIVVLLRPFHGTHNQVAEAVGIGARTLRTWLNQPSFQERLKEGRARMWGESLDTITGSLNLASEVLVQLLKSESENVRLRAALGIVDAAIKCHETFEIEQRVSALESALENRRR